MKTDGEQRFIKLMIVEDQKEVREGLRYLLDLDPRIQVVKTFERADELLEFLPGLSLPDMVLMDIGLPGLSGIEATKAIRKKFPEMKVIILTVFEDEEKLLSSIRAGANGYILKNTKPEMLLEQLLSAASDGTPLSPQVARRLFEDIKRRGDDENHEDYGLTPREKQIISDVADGMTSPEIARKHNIADSTAKKHILHIYQKLGVSSKAEFVRKAIRENLA
ncbi:MAG: DNA-binding response regulator [Treponema sp. GWB1_62_6]|nr:MAG: DNA-binding response regulator [Treponema sp. GWA1_62_8]OHE64710.1 MAG: DNA-binding response regulator [Treponema sp. GWC1_61_84]OHE67735.1 MAG: DNA-binding response regulator [Treponema sp. GWB1_62_6]OHE75617.1 MAG: DNA-binding response regulator [Treponema sp. RIFOXYC1_FULL_61_9]HCM27544.1 DNA-binding response regulator [Treponema sp.]